MSNLQVERALSGVQIASVRSLFGEYAEMLGQLHGHACLDGFACETAGLPGAYAADQGGELLLALCDSQAAGCVAMRRLDLKSGEMKRLYCRSAFRGRGIGRRLAQAILDSARELGYTRICLDTMPVMVEARRLYESLSFVPNDSFSPTPTPGALFFQCVLNEAKSK